MTTMMKGLIAATLVALVAACTSAPITSEQQANQFRAEAMSGSR